MKLKKLSTEEIRSFIHEMPSRSYLPLKLFPSPYSQIDIMEYGDKNLFNYLESIDSKLRNGFICNLYHFSFQLENNPDMIILASCKTSYTETLYKELEEYKNKLSENEKDDESINNLQRKIDNYDKFSKIISQYDINEDNSWIFLAISRFIRSYIDSFSAERILWSFCSEYFEDEDLELLSSSIKKDINIELEIDYKDRFPYVVNVPIKAHVPISIDDAHFTDCVEVSILHFFYMTQPTKIDLIISFWDSLNSPLKDKIKDFFRFVQGPKKANNDDASVRQIWAEIVSRIPGLIYKKKSDPSLSYFDVELKAGWFNYLKTISYLKNDKETWNELCELQKRLTEERKILPEFKTETCKLLMKLAGKTLQSVEWIHKHYYEGIRDMEDGTLDLLGVIKCTFENVSEQIGYVMLDGHGFVNWMKYIYT